MKTQLQIKWLLLVLMIVLFGNGACNDDESPMEEQPLYNVIKLNMNDHRFDDLRTVSVLTDIECQSNSGNIFKLFNRNDSLFITYFGSLLYPTRLPDDFPIYGNPFVFSGTVKQMPKGADYYPLILDEFKYELLMEMELHFMK